MLEKKYLLEISSKSHLTLSNNILNDLNNIPVGSTKKKNIFEGCKKNLFVLS
jgi:hypothetical protein